ncbi:MAG: DNA alkylation repair protein, partial [Clostridia bacterium]|nr:DNA alkylation repair protein [Clostridia bacterium]
MSFVDEDYAKFSKKLGVGKLEPVGIRVPKLREIAKQLSKQNWREFFDCEKNDCPEIIILKGLCLGNAKIDFDEFLQYLAKFFDMVESWAETDISASNFKIVKKNLEKTFGFVLPYLHSGEEYKVRLAVIILLDYFVCDEWIDTVLDQIQKIEFGKYYIDMAVAWLVSVCF